MVPPRLGMMTLLHSACHASQIAFGTVVLVPFIPKKAYIHSKIGYQHPYTYS